jgi:Zn finger protein HypA/HybF involved in hydrogenase expression
MLKSKIKLYCKCESCSDYFETDKRKMYCSRKCQNRKAYLKKIGKPMTETIAYDSGRVVTIRTY